MRWWLSFVDLDRETGDKFLGVCAVEDESLEDVVQEARWLRLNPGGEVRGMVLADSAVPGLVGRFGTKRLLTKAECHELGHFSAWERMS